MIKRGTANLFSNQDLSCNRWASIEYNGRFTCIDTGNWWYEHMVINVAVGDFIPSNCFMASEPIENLRN
jgi:hypothetical protein